jgi:biopolymer transport protein ExbB
MIPTNRFRWCIALNGVLCLMMCLPVEVLAQDQTAAPRGGLNFFQMLVLGGWFMIPLGLLSILVIAISIERYLALRREKILPAPFLEQLGLLSQSPAGLDPRRVYKICQTFPSSAAYVMKAALVKIGRPQSEIEKAVNESAQREATRLSHMNSWLTLAAALAPLIGLLGTVWGITQAFYEMTQMTTMGVGQNRGMALANGIYVALVTTIAGLSIAIPATILSHFYDNRIVSLLNDIEEMVGSLIPQFERYEGQIRYSDAETEAMAEVES